MRFVPQKEGNHMQYTCPVCGEPLYKEINSLVCPNRHSFDIARQGYVNLLTVQQKHSLDPGDTRQQVLARRATMPPSPMPSTMRRFAAMRKGKFWTSAAARATIPPDWLLPWAHP